MKQLSNQANRIIQFWILALGFSFLLCFCTLAYGQAAKPNVVVILADDIGQGDLSVYRSLHSDKILLNTPNLDALARDGVMFTDGHSPAALCAPTRYAVMTGQHCFRSSRPWGVWSAFAASAIRDEQLTLGRLMQQAGYQTAFMGKWHLGGRYYPKGDTTRFYEVSRIKPQLGVDIRRIVDDGPTTKGFDESFVFPAGIQNVPYAVYENDVWMPLENDSKIVPIMQKDMDKIGVKLDKEEGLEDSHWDPHDMGPLLANRAISYIREHAHDSKPFFLYYCSLAVHLPHTPTDSLDGVSVKGTTPSPHMDMIKELDVQMGMLINALKEQGIYDNTVFIFTSDNGGLLRPETLQSGHRPSDIYRGGKNQIYEGGHRVPFIVSWPETIAAGMSDAPVLGIDILATLADLTEVDLSKEVAIDGESLLPILTRSSTKPVHEVLLVQSGTRKEVAITQDGWKLIIQTPRKKIRKRSPIALFNLTDNIQEAKSGNLIHDPAQQERVKTMFEAYNQRNRR